MGGLFDSPHWRRRRALEKRLADGTITQAEYDSEITFLRWANEDSRGEL